MCGRFTLVTTSDVLAEYFDLVEATGQPPRYNIAPTQSVPVVRIKNETAKREMCSMRWGLIPSWAKETSIGSKMINARSETLAEKPSFRSAYNHRRCLVVADGFYEWKKIHQRKQPYYIRLQDGGPFAFAGLWERWPGDRDGSIESCTIIPTTPNELMADLHHRMPVILKPEDYSTWLDPTLSGGETIQSLLQPFPTDRMEAYAVDTVVNSPANDKPVCIEPLAI